MTFMNSGANIKQFQLIKFKRGMQYEKYSGCGMFFIRKELH